MKVKKRTINPSTKSWRKISKNLPATYKTNVSQSHQSKPNEDNQPKNQPIVNMQ